MTPFAQFMRLAGRVSLVLSAFPPVIILADETLFDQFWLPMAFAWMALTFVSILCYAVAYTLKGYGQSPVFLDFWKIFE